MVRAIFAECLVSPQSGHNYPEVKCMACTRHAAYVRKTVGRDLLEGSDDRLLLCLMAYRSLFMPQTLVNSFSRQKGVCQGGIDIFLIKMRKPLSYK